MKNMIDAEALEGQGRKILDASVAASFISGIQGIFFKTGDGEDGYRFQHKLYPLTVITSAAIEADGKRWLHVSLAHQKRIPDYSEIQRVRKHFIGEDKYAVIVFPPKDFYVNLNPNCIHLWHCIDGHPLPEFSGQLKSGERVI